MSLISLLVILLVVVLLVWVARTVLPLLGLPQPVVTMLYVICVCLLVIWLLQQFAGGLPSLRIQ